LRPIHLARGKDAAWPEKAQQKYAEDRVVTAESDGGSYCGFVMEVGDATTYPNAKAFLDAVNNKSSLDISKLETGSVQYWSAAGKKLTLQFNHENDLPHVYRDDAEVDWNRRRALFHCAGESTPVEQDWQDGTLRVVAGGHAFECTVDEKGKVTFSNKPTK